MLSKMIMPAVVLAAISSSMASATSPAAPLWTQNHSSQVKSFASRMVDALPVVASGSEYISDQDVSVLHAHTGEPFWSSTAMQEWTYGVALQPLTADPTSSTVGLVAFGCPFFASGIPPPCVLGFWKDATMGNLTWKVPLEGATLSASSGPPSVYFSADGLQILAVYTKPGADPSVPPVEYVAVVSSTDGTLVATQRLVGAGTGHGVHVQQPDPLSPPPPTTNALISLPGSSSSNASVPGRVEFHFALTLDKDGLHPNNTPLIDCNGTSSCAFLAASSDLKLVVVNAVPVSNNQPASMQVCPPLPMDAERWGFALYRGDGVSATMPTPYATQWAVCADANQKPTKERRALNSVSVVANSSRVVAVFSHIVQGTTTSNGVSACAYDAETGNEVWCTQKTKIAPPSPTAISPIVASHDDGLVVVGVAGIGLLAVDANPSAAAPKQMRMIYSQGKADDCCGATAIEVVGATGNSKTVVASEAPISLVNTVAASHPLLFSSCAWRTS